MICLCVVLPDNDESRRVVNEIWKDARAGPKNRDSRPTASNAPQRGTAVRRNVVSGDADLPDSDDEDPDAGADVGGGSPGQPWDDPDFPTPSTIKVREQTFTGIQWIRPPVRVYYITLLWLL